ncbi:4-nitrophenylphosphatase-like [Ostrinia furnacalis]|uniref:4-nitrophenylphosphatase-like n=1 Tax=Ostrinia furnacalis TaxID=93504 RepID=UPI00103F4111|nr:4-nitrophenylphosphatase-like [Ostrinia furnacalis]
MIGPVNVTELSASAFKQFLDSFDHVFSDCDGVIWTNNTLPGSGEFFEKIKQHGKSVHYVSNNSLRTQENYEGKFKAAGIENGFEKLTIPSTAIAEYLKSIKFSKKVYCVACPQTIKILEANGFECVEGPESVKGYEDYLKSLDGDPDVGAVVFDSDFRINLIKLSTAIIHLRRPDVIFLNGASDRYLPVKPGHLALGTGPFNDIVIEESKREPIQLGKPGKIFGEFAMKRAGFTDPSRILFIGDMIEQDVGLGKNCGFKTLLVLTSNTEEDMMASNIKPDYYAETLGSLVPLL